MRVSAVNAKAMLLCGVVYACFLTTNAARGTDFEKTPSKSVVKSISVTEGTNMSATVSPDHKTIILDLQETLWSLPISGGQAKRLTDPLLEPSRPDWSPKGDLVAFQGYKGGTATIVNRGYRPTEPRWLLLQTAAFKAITTSG
jgi:Tol biopolymer transport system component